MAERVFLRTLLAAAGCHAVALFLVSRISPPATSEVARSTRAEVEIDFDFERNTPPPSVPKKVVQAAPAESQKAPPGHRRIVQRTPSAELPAVPLKPSGELAAADVSPGLEAGGGSPLTSGTAGPAGEPTPASSGRLTPEQLGLGAKNPFLLSEMRTIDPTVRAEKRLRRNMAQATLDADKGRSMGVHGPVARALSQAAMGIVPPRSVARFLAVTDEQGFVRHLSVISSSLGRPQWKTVASRALAALSKSRLRVPAGNRLQLTLEVTSKVQFPSGGGPEGDSMGLSLSFDLADLGATARQVVQARLIRQTVL